MSSGHHERHRQLIPDMEVRVVTSVPGVGVAVLVPLLQRPHRVAAVHDSITSATPGARVVYLCSPGDDHVIAEAEAAVAGTGHRVVVVTWPPGDGDYARKINHGAATTDEPLVFLAADDLAFQPGWLEACLSVMGPRIGVVGTNDLGNCRVLRGEHATHSLVARWYIDECGTIDRPGIVLHEGYPHEYVDDELVETARCRHAWAFAHDSIVEHLHPNFGKAPTDQIYDAQQDRMRRGRSLFLTRRHLWM